MTVSISSNVTTAPSSSETIAISSGTVTLSSAPTVALSSGTVTLSSNPTVIPAPTTSGGVTVYSITASTGTNSTLVSTAACQLYGVDLFNTTNTPAFLRLYNLSTAPTEGTSTYRVVMAWPTVGSTSGGITTTSFSVNNTYGVPFSTGLGFTITAAIASTDTTAVGSSVFIANIYYK